jgi:alpha-L-arabinofuranosidase
MSYTETPRLMSLAGRDDETGDIIIKMVNATPDAYLTNINLSGVADPSGTGELITLSADRPEAENSLTEPTKYIPKTSTITGVQKSFETSFPAYSISVLRIADKGWKAKAKK